MMATEQIGLLLVEDSLSDETLICRELRKQGFEFKEFLRVESEAAYRAALAAWKWDLIISDYSLPFFDGIKALHIFKEYPRDIPFILVSGTIGEELAIQALKEGASDCLLKGRLQKLGPTVKRELAAADQRRQTAAKEEKLRHSQKLEAIGQLAGGVAHDFNNILTVITMYCDLMAAKLQPDDPLSVDVSEVRKAAETGAALTKRLLAFSRKQVMNKRPTDPVGLVWQLSEMLVRLLGAEIKLKTDLKEPLPRCVIDASQIESVIMNLVVNARDAIAGRGEIRLSVFRRLIDPAQAKLEHGIAGDFVVVSISDTGSGMDQAVMAHLFEPFFTTKEKHKGTGLGLSTAFGIVQQSGGFISVQSTVGVGSTFSIHLPVEVSERPEWEDA